jgi:hypothetical protein
MEGGEPRHRAVCADQDNFVVAEYQAKKIAEASPEVVRARKIRILCGAIVRQMISAIDGVPDLHETSLSLLAAVGSLTDPDLRSLLAGARKKLGVKNPTIFLEPVIKNFGGAAEIEIMIRW